MLLLWEGELVRERRLALTDLVHFMILFRHQLSVRQDAVVCVLLPILFLGFIRLLIRQVPWLWLLLLALVLLLHLFLWTSFLIDVLERLYIIFELLLGNLIDLVDHEYVLLEAAEELLEPRLWRPLRRLLPLGTATSPSSIDGGRAGCSRVLDLEALVRMTPANKVFNHALYRISIRQDIDIVIIDEIVGGRRAQRDSRMISAILDQLLQLLTELFLSFHLTGRPLL